MLSLSPPDNQDSYTKGLIGQVAYTDGYVGQRNDSSPGKEGSG